MGFISQSKTAQGLERKKTLRNMSSRYHETDIHNYTARVDNEEEKERLVRKIEPIGHLVWTREMERKWGDRGIEELIVKDKPKRQCEH
jgi:hypothetical protein